jgi:hypothetical protein
MDWILPVFEDFAAKNTNPESSNQRLLLSFLNPVILRNLNNQQNFIGWSET